MPDSQSLLISSAKSRAELHRIFLLSLHTGDIKQITSPPPLTNPGDGDYWPALSPDGKTLAFVRGIGESGDIYVQTLAGGPARRITKNSHLINSLTWINNREIVYGNGYFGAAALWRISVDESSEPEPVPGSAAGAHHPTVQPSGRQTGTPGLQPVRRRHLHLADGGRTRSRRPRPHGHRSRRRHRLHAHRPAKPILARRPPDRLRLRPRRLHGDLGQRQRRLEPLAVDQLQEPALRHATLVSRRSPDRFRLPCRG